MNLFSKIGRALAKDLFCLNIQQQSGERSENSYWTASSIASLKALEEQNKNVLNRIYKVLEHQSELRFFDI